MSGVRRHWPDARQLESRVGVFYPEPPQASPALEAIDYAHRMMVRDLHVTCPACCGPVVKLAESVPDQWVATVVLRCKQCGRKWQLRAAITPVPIMEGATPHGACGSEYGYQRHRKDGEPACDDCREAHSAGKSRAGFRRRKVSV